MWQSFEYLAKSILWAGLKRLFSDDSASANNLGTSKVGIIIVYIDEILFFWSDIQENNTARNYMTDRYKMKDPGLFGWFTEIKPDQNIDKKIISLSQELYLCKAFDLVDISDCKLTLSPILAYSNLKKYPEDVGDEKLIQSYQSDLGILLWISL